VAEALARGKVCLAARRGGLTEVAPDLVDAIDAEEPDDLARRVVEYLANPALLSAKEELIRRRYRPTHWEETARTVRGVLESAVAGSGGTLSAV
jgi:glycosyltransferase involved in cell wall biosynthesis